MSGTPVLIQMMLLLKLLLMLLRLLLLLLLLLYAFYHVLMWGREAPPSIITPNTVGLPPKIKSRKSEI